MPEFGPPRIVETHVSTLFMVGDMTFKVKKPIRTGFLDFATREARELACHREVDLNRRFAPDVYLGVDDVSREGVMIDHVVVMKRLPDDRRLSMRLELPSVREELRELARLIVEVHGDSPRGLEIDAASGHDAVCALWNEGLEQLGEFAGGPLERRDLERMATLVGHYLGGRRPLFDQRIRDGRALDGHGDLLAEDIFCLDDGPRLLDCLEFDDRLRFGDALNDVAFLAMDLERLGHPEAGSYLLECYAEFSGDSWPDSLAHHYVAYRAQVRAKVACLRHAQGDEAAGNAAQELVALCLRHLEAAKVRLILVGGSPGTGKSTVSTELGARLGAVVISSDAVRDELHPRNGSATDEFGQGRYVPDLVDAVYDEMLGRAEALVSHGVSVVLDASWLDVERRDRAADVASGSDAVLVELRCVCDGEVAADRIRRRRAAGIDPSEATESIAATMATRAAAWAGAEELDTREPLGAVVVLAESIVLST